MGEPDEAEQPALRDGRYVLTRKLGAVRSGRVFIVESRLLEPGPSIGRGLEQLAEALHPGATG